MIAGFSAFGPLSHLREHLEAGHTEQVVALAVLLLLHVLGVVGQLHVARHFQAPPPEETEGPVFGRRDLAWLFGPTVPLALAGAVFPALGLTGTGTWWALPLWLSSLVLALLVHPCRRRPVLWGGLAASLVLGAASVLQDPAGPADTAVGFLVWCVITACMICLLYTSPSPRDSILNLV